MRQKAVLLVVATFVVLLLFSCGKPAGREEEGGRAYSDRLPMPAGALSVDVTGTHGGRLVTASLSDPKTFNPIVYSDEMSQTLGQLTQAGLTEFDLIRQEPTPGLAGSWETSADKLTWTFHLRKGLQWSDGQPFTADDVLFTMQLILDPAIPSGAQDALTPEAGWTIAWDKVDEHTVTAHLPSVFVSFLRQLDGPTVPILPKHVWEPVYREGKVPQAMGVNMDLRKFVCLGAFKISQYKQGQKLVLTRNPYYWKKDRDGKRLPYLDEIDFLIMPTQDQTYLKIERGEIDTFYTVRPENVDDLMRKAKTIGMRVQRVGPSLDTEGMWFNENGDKNPSSRKPYVDPVKRAWFTDVKFRKAVSYGINRQGLVDNALFGKGVPAYGPESVSNRLWYLDDITKYPYDPEKALSLLRSSGFVQKKTDPNGKPVLYDRKGNEVRFTLNTNAGNTLRNTECMLIASDLGKLGMQVEYSPVDFNTLVSKIQDNFEYDAILIAVTHDDVDPTSGMNIWDSKGTLHFWWPRQKTAHTPWEKRIDELMELQSKTYDMSERKKYYDEFQRIVTDQVPIIFTTTQMIYVCGKEKLGNFKPSVSRHRTLWNAAELYWK